jgi:hypothetical protein
MRLASTTSPINPEISEALQKTLDYEGKIDRSERNMQTLIAEGRTKAQEFPTTRVKRTDGPA